MENRFQSPLTDRMADKPHEGGRPFLRQVAVNQRAVLVCIAISLLHYFLAGAFIALDRPNPEVVGLIFLLIFLAIAMAGTIYLFRLASLLYNPIVAFVCSILIPLPMINLLVLFFITNKATTLLKKNGVKVGLLGARVSKL